jgi:hypothetical protein
VPTTATTYATILQPRLHAAGLDDTTPTHLHVVGLDDTVAVGELVQQLDQCATATAPAAEHHIPAGDAASVDLAPRSLVPTG